jgi:hypothetical protein
MELQNQDFLPLVLVILFFNSSGTAQGNQQQQIPTLTYEELIKDRDANRGKTVRLNAVWTYGFEWSYLCSSECKNLDRAWVSIVDSEELCDGSTKKLKKMGKKFDNKAGVIVIGKLETGGGFGHMGAYHLQFKISCVEKYQKIY